MLHNKGDGLSLDRHGNLGDVVKEHVHNGEKMDTIDAVALRQLTDRIVVYDERLEIHLRCEATITVEFVE